MLQRLDGDKVGRRRVKDRFVTWYEASGFILCPELAEDRGQESAGILAQDLISINEGKPVVLCRLLRGQQGL